MRYPITKPLFGDEEIENLKEVFLSGWATQGPKTIEFEKLFSDRHHVQHSLATTSCTSALHLAMMALEIQEGDEVIVPAFTWVTSAYCVKYVGAKVVFADIDLESFNIDPESIRQSITPKTKAIIVVHLFGLAANMNAIREIAEEHNLYIVEDAACAVGTTYKGQSVGGLGDVGCFSFHPRKVITTGEGGMVTTNSDDLANRISALRNHGATSFLHPELDEERGKPWFMAPFDMVGYNLRLSDIQSAVGVVQMARLEGLLEERLSGATRYNQMLKDCGEDIALPVAPAEFGHTYQSYVIRVLEGGRSRRNRVMEYLAESQIQTRPGTHAVHRLGYFREAQGCTPEDYPNSCVAEDTTITLPLYPNMSTRDQEFISDKVMQGLKLSAERS